MFIVVRKIPRCLQNTFSRERTRPKDWSKVCQTSIEKKMCVCPNCTAWYINQMCYKILLTRNGKPIINTETRVILHFKFVNINIFINDCVHDNVLLQLLNKMWMFRDLKQDDVLVIQSTASLFTIKEVESIFNKIIWNLA